VPDVFAARGGADQGKGVGAEVSGSFLKKEPKNFCPLARVPGDQARAQAGKVFFASFFFRKQKCFLLVVEPPSAFHPTG
jgi:hypothetical protein